MKSEKPPNIFLKKPLLY